MAKMTNLATMAQAAHRAARKTGQRVADLDRFAARMVEGKKAQMRLASGKVVTVTLFAVTNQGFNGIVAMGRTRTGEVRQAPMANVKVFIEA